MFNIDETRARHEAYKEHPGISLQPGDVCS